MALDMERLLDAVEQVESGGNVHAISPAGALGPYQFMPATAEEYGVKDPFDRDQARTGARKYLTKLLSQNNNDLNRALAAWNWGPGNLARKGYDNMPEETQNFIPKVMSEYDRLGALNPQLPNAGDGSELFPGAPSEDTLPAENMNDPELLFPHSRESERLAYNMANAGSPEKAARIYDLEGRTGLPTAFIEQNLDELEQQVKKTDFDPVAFRKESPKLASWLAEDPTRAALATDDYDTLTAMEKLWKTVDAAAYGTVEGINTHEYMMLGAKAAQGTITEAEELKRKELGLKIAEGQSLFSRGLPRYIKSGTQLVGTNLPIVAEAANKGILIGMPSGAALGSVGGLPGAAVGAVRGIGVVGTASVINDTYLLSVGEAFNQLEGTMDESGNPVDPKAIQMASYLVAVPNALLEFASMRKVIRVIPGADKVLGKLGVMQMKKVLAKPSMTKAMIDISKKYAGATFTEAWTEMMQDFMIALSREIVEGDEINIEREDVQGALGSAKTVAEGMIGLFPFIVGPKVVTTYKDMQNAQRDADFLTTLGELVAESKTQQRSPEAVGDYVAKLKEDSNIQEVYVPFDKWMAVFQEDAPKAAQEVFGGLKEYGEAKVTGGELVIPIDTYTKRIAGTEYFNQLTPHVRFSSDGISLAEAEEVKQSEPEIIKRMTEDFEVVHAKNEALNQVFDTVYQQEIKTGSSEIEAQRNATLWRMRLESRAERLGRDPLELYNENPLGIRRFLPGQKLPPHALQQVKRGAYLPYENMIIKLARANPSTFLHESGHAWLEELRQDALHPDAPAQLKQDWETVKEWTGAMDEVISREAHEKFARGIEAHVMEGKSPIMQVTEIFSQFREWLKRIYGAVTALNVPLTDDVRDVMDRLVATDAAIKQARENNIYQQSLFKADMLRPEEAAIYAAMNETAKQTAEDSLRAKVLKALQREDTATWRKNETAMRKAVRKEILKTRRYKTIYWLQNGKLPNGKAVEGIGTTKLDRKIVRELGYNLSELPKDITQQNGLHPDMVAELMGYDSGRGMLADLHQQPTLNEAIEAETAARMQEKHGDRLSPDDLAVQASIEVQNDKQIEMFNFELKILKRLGARREKAHPAVLKDLARSIIQRKTVGDVRPYVYRDAAIKAGNMAEEALIAKDFDKAFDFKQQQILNMLLQREAQKVQDHINKRVKSWTRKLNRADSKVKTYYNLDAYNAARVIAAGYGLGIQKKVESAKTYMGLIAQYDPMTYADLNDAVQLAVDGSKPLKDIEVGDFFVLQEALEGMLKTARRMQQTRINGQLVNRTEFIQKLTDRNNEIMGDGQKSGEVLARTLTKAEKRRIKISSLRSATRRVEHWVDGMGGAYWDLWNAVREPADLYHEDRIRVQERLERIVIEYGKTYEIGGTIEAPELGFAFENKGQLMGALRHAGNPSNLRKLLLAERKLPDGTVIKPWGELTADGELVTTRWDKFIERMQREGVLTQADYEFTQAVWDIFKDLKPKAQHAHHEVYGFYFNEITATPIQTPWGVYEGGYYPAITDQYEVTDTSVREGGMLVENKSRSNLFPTAGSGRFKQRSENYAKALDLDINSTQKHIGQVLRFIHFEPVVRDIGRVVNDPAFRESVAQIDRTAVDEMLLPWLDRTAKQIVERPSESMAGRTADTIIRGLRRRQGLNIMFGSASVSLQQYTGISLAAAKVKPRYLAGALTTLTTSPIETTKIINEASVFMRNRVATHAIEVQQVIEEILINPSKYDKAVDFAARHGYFMQVATQTMVDRVTWMGAYNQAIAEGHSEKTAVRKADSAVRETQGSFNPEDISAFEAGPAWRRVFLMFYSFFNMAANLAMTEFVKMSRETGLSAAHRVGRSLYIYTTAFMIPAVVAEAIAQAVGGDLFDDEDDDGYLDTLAELFFGGQVKMATAMIPGAGQVIQAAVNRIDDKWYNDSISTSPAVSGLEAVTRIPFHAYRFATEDEVRLKPVIQDINTVFGLATGIPLTPAAKAAGYLTDIEQGYAEEPVNEADLVRGLISGRSIE